MLPKWFEGEPEDASPLATKVQVPISLPRVGNSLGSQPLGLFGKVGFHVSQNKIIMGKRRDCFRNQTFSFFRLSSFARYANVTNNLHPHLSHAI